MVRVLALALALRSATMAKSTITSVLDVGVIGLRLLSVCVLYVFGACLLIGAMTASGHAQSQLPSPPGMQKKPPEAPAKLPRVSPDKTSNLDFLFGALKAAPDGASAKAVEAKIWSVWSTTTSDTAALLMQRVKVAIEHKQMDVALKLLDAVIKLRPDYIEGWNRRATLYYMKNEYARSMSDIREVLIREPRHFGALAGLGMIMQEIGDDKRALDAFRKALAINPHLERIPEYIKSLSEKIEGRDI